MFDIYSVLLLVFALIITYGLTKIARIYALKQGLIDSPGYRTSHQNNTPRGGGISIVITFLLFVVALMLWDNFKSINNTYMSSIILGGTIVATLGFWDDHQNIAVKWRFLVQLLAASGSLLLLSELPEISFFSMQTNLSFGALPFYSVVLIWLLNLFNFMDGIDGIASVEAISVSIGAALGCRNPRPYADYCILGFRSSRNSCKFLCISAKMLGI